MARSLTSDVVITAALSTLMSLLVLTAALAEPMPDFDATFNLFGKTATEAQEGRGLLRASSYGETAKRPPRATGRGGRANRRVVERRFERYCRKAGKTSRSWMRFRGVKRYC